MSGRAIRDHGHDARTSTARGTARHLRHDLGPTRRARTRRPTRPGMLRHDDSATAQPVERARTFPSSRSCRTRRVANRSREDRSGLVGGPRRPGPKAEARSPGRSRNANVCRLTRRSKCSPRPAPRNPRPVWSVAASCRRLGKTRTRIATSNLKDTKVALPEGMTANPSLASGSGACTPQQYAVGNKLLAAGRRLSPGIEDRVDRNRNAASLRKRSPARSTSPHRMTTRSANPDIPAVAARAVCRREGPAAGDHRSKSRGRSNRTPSPGSS